MSDSAKKSQAKKLIDEAGMFVVVANNKICFSGSEIQLAGMVSALVFSTADTLGVNPLLLCDMIKNTVRKVMEK